MKNVKWEMINDPVATARGSVALFAFALSLFDRSRLYNSQRLP